MANGTRLVITHIPTGYTVKLGDFALTEFSDSVSTSWNKQEVYGRMDPIMNYQGTSREISMGISYKDLSVDFIKERHKEITQLMAFQYPTYAATDNAMAIQSPPLLRVSFANLISQGFENNSEGLVCAMDGCSYTPQVGFTPEDSPMVRFGGLRAGSDGDLLKETAANAAILPKQISLKLKFVVLHEHSLGWHFKADKTAYDWMGPPNASFGPGFMHPKFGGVDPDAEVPETKKGAEEEED
jgi:hypothetical protein